LSTWCVFFLRVLSHSPPLFYVCGIFHVDWFHSCIPPAFVFPFPTCVGISSATPPFPQHTAPPDLHCVPPTVDQHWTRAWRSSVRPCHCSLRSMSSKFLFLLWECRDLPPPVSFLTAPLFLGTVFTGGVFLNDCKKVRPLPLLFFHTGINTPAPPINLPLPACAGPYGGGFLLFS